MKIIDFETISRLDIKPETCIEWVLEAFQQKYNSVLPEKISLKMNNDVYFNTMPCLMPDINRFGVKVVSRFPKRNPSLKGDILLYDTVTGDLLAMMDANWITAMRTGAVAALAINTFRSSSTKKYAFIGLGNTARATLLCLSSSNKDNLYVKLLQYKNQAEIFIERFRNHKNIHFEIVKTTEELIQDTDVIVSCITATNSIIAEDKYFKEGILVVPVHTRGFQNCDLFFDKVFVDDIGHVRNFKYFNHFKSCVEFSRVLLNTADGRVSDKERIISYNIGIALHDVFFASKIYNILLKDNDAKELILSNEDNKFWV